MYPRYLCSNVHPTCYLVAIVALTATYGTELGLPTAETTGILDMYLVRALNVSVSEGPNNGILSTSRRVLMHLTPQLALRPASDGELNSCVPTLGTEASRNCRDGASQRGFARAPFHRSRTVSLVSVRAGSVPPMLCMRLSPLSRLLTGATYRTGRGSDEAPCRQAERRSKKEPELTNERDPRGAYRFSNFSKYYSYAAQKASGYICAKRKESQPAAPRQ